MKKVMTAMAMFCSLAAAPAHAQTYWRLETGYSDANSAGFKDRDFANFGIICADSFCGNAAKLDNIGDSPILGVGVGHRFTPHLRADVTLTYRGGYRLNEKGADAHYSATIRSTALMLNGYYDFMAGNGGPYLGLGVGWAQNRMGTMVQDFGGFPNVVGFHTMLSGAKKNNAAFALMAGVGIPISGWTIDLGYRYVNLGKFETGTVYSSRFFSMSLPSIGASGKLTAHELTLGFRF